MAKNIDARKFLSRVVYKRPEVDGWLKGDQYIFARYNGELGWLLRNAHFDEGVDGSTCYYEYVGDGAHERRTIAYADKPCRINTYGDSFTMCHQVNDGETWQEVLGSHLLEPVRNFGVGAWSVYQAFLRMKIEEERVPSDLIILNIYDDDHYRNLDAWRNIRAGKDRRFLCPPCPHLKVNLETGKCEEMPNPCPTSDSVYNLCDLDWAVDRFKDDFVLNIMLAHANAKAGNPDRAYQAIMDLTKTHGINTRIDRGDTVSRSAQVLHAKAALLATTQIVKWTEEYAKQKGKQVLYVLSFNAGTVARKLSEGTRFDQSFVDYLKRENLPHVDLLAKHEEEYARFKGSVEQYLAQYYIGHYNPRGNFFTAMAIKPKLVEMLDPKPLPYRWDAPAKK